MTVADHFPLFPSPLHEQLPALTGRVKAWDTFLTGQQIVFAKKKP